MTQNLVAITGATGFIGNHLSGRLLDGGYRVRVLARNPDKASALVDSGATLVVGDLQDAAALRELVTGADAVVHAAGAVRGGSQQAFDTPNVAGTAALLEAIGSVNPHARLLFLSSLAAREPHLSWYAHSKWEAEQLLLGRSLLDSVILRPPPVYGPGDREMLPVFAWMARGIAPVPGSPSARTSLIHVDDLVAAALACLQNKGSKGQVLYACDGRDGGYDWAELAAVAGAVWSRQVSIWRVPRWLLDAVARVNLELSRLSGAAPMLTPPKLRELRHADWVVDNASIFEATGWQPRISLNEGLATLGIRAK